MLVIRKTEHKSGYNSINSITISVWLFGFIPILYYKHSAK